MTATVTEQPSRTSNPMESRPDLGAAMMAMRQAIREQRRLPNRLIELMRLRIAFRNQCRPCMSMRYNDAIEDGLTEEMVCSLEKPEEAADMTPAEKAAVAYADQFAVDHLAISRQRDALAKHFDATEIAEIAILVGFFVGFGRIGAVFDDGAELPVGQRHANGDPLAPWGVEEPIVMR